MSRHWFLSALSSSFSVLSSSSLSVIWPYLPQIFAIFLLSRSHFRLSFIGLSLHYHVLAIFSLLPLLCYPTYSCHYHAPSLLFCLPHFTTIITIQFHSLGIRGMVQVYSSSFVAIIWRFSSIFHCLSRFPPSSQRCLELLVWLSRWLRTVTNSSWEGMMSCAPLHTRNWIDT